MRVTSDLIKSVVVEETTTTDGTGPYLLNGATAGYFSFNEIYEDGDEITYRVTDGGFADELTARGVDGPNVETVIGIFDSSANSLSRDTIIVSSNDDNLVNWQSGTRRLIRPLHPAIAQLQFGAISSGIDTLGWKFPSMMDSSQGTLSVWIYLSTTQVDMTTGFVKPGANGDLFQDNRAYLLKNPGSGASEDFIAVGGFQSWIHVSSGSYTPINDIVDISRTNPTVITFSAAHGFHADSYITEFFPGHANEDITGPWVDIITGLPGLQSWSRIISVTDTTITVDADCSGATIPFITPSGDNTFGHAGASFQVVNSLQLTLSDSTGNKQLVWKTGAAIPHDQWVNVLLSWDTNFSAGNKIVILYYDDEQQIPSAIVDVDSAFDIYYSEPLIDEERSWSIGGSFSLPFGVSCYMAELWFAPGQFVDFTDSANRLKFHSLTGRPVFLGGDGSLPTGASPKLYLTQPSSPSTSPVKWIDPGGEPILDLTRLSGACLSQVAPPLGNGVTSSSLLTFSFWCDQLTVGNILDVGGHASSTNGNINLYNGTCTVHLVNGSGRFIFTFPYYVGTEGGNIRVGVDMNHAIGSKVVNAYVNGVAATVTVVTDNTNNLSMDWTPIIRFFFNSVGYIGDLWVAPGYYVDPGPFFYSAGVVGELPSTTPAMYFHIEGTDTADDFATNQGNGGPFEIQGDAATPHFSLLSATEFYRNFSCAGILQLGEGTTTLRLSPVSFLSI